MLDDYCYIDVIFAQNRAGHSVLKQHGGETGSCGNTLSLDSWKTGGGNGGDSGCTNQTGTTIPMGGNTGNYVSSVATSLADSSSHQLHRNHGGKAHVNNHNERRIHKNVAGNGGEAMVASAVYMPLPPGIHPQIGDFINSHHLMSPSHRNNICRYE